MIRDTGLSDRAIEKIPNKKRIPIVVTLVSLISVLILLYFNFDQWLSADLSVDRQRIQIATISRGDFEKSISVQARVVAATRPTLFSFVNGIITPSVKVGEHVSKGQLLAKIISPDVDNLLAQEIALLEKYELIYNKYKNEVVLLKLLRKQELEELEIDLSAAERYMARAEISYKLNTISAQQHEGAKDDLMKLDTRKKHVSEKLNIENINSDFQLQTFELDASLQRLQVKKAKLMASKLLIRSPVSGVVGNLYVKQGDVVVRNQKVVTIIDLADLELNIEIPEDYADDISVGLLAKITFQGDNYDGKLISISPEVNNSYVSGTVKFVDNIPRMIKQNQRVSVNVFIENKPDTLMVKRGPFIEGTGGNSAYQVMDDIAFKTPIKIGAISLSEIEILSGLKVGDKIIISSTNQFKGVDSVRIR